MDNTPAPPDASDTSDAKVLDLRPTKPSSKHLMVEELNRMLGQLNTVRRLVQAATPLASGLTVTKDLDKLGRALEKVKDEIRGLPI